MRLKFFYAILLVVVFSACENSKEEFVTESYKEYFPLGISKSITYRVDSTVFTQSGSKVEVHKYQVKHTVQSEIADNQGRKAYLINRLIRNEAGTTPWLENGNYTVTPLDDQAEVVENNLRVIRLRNPMKKNFSWRGNAYLPGSPYRPAYDMDAGSDMNQWQFTYSDFGDTTVNGQSYQNVWSVEHANNVLNLPPVPGTNAYGLMEVSREKYAKGIGLVYRKHDVYEYQPGHADNSYQPAYSGFGITMWMIEHN